jgi:hypothetical protein
MAVSENERKIDHLKRENEEYTTTLQEIQIDGKIIVLRI